MNWGNQNRSSEPVRRLPHQSHWKMRSPEPINKTNIYWALSM